MGWIIYNTTEPDLCWSNGYGWTEEDYDTFDDIERQNIRLPIGGAWERVPWGKQETETGFNPLTRSGNL